MQERKLNIQEVQGDLLEYIRNNYVAIYIESDEQSYWLKDNNCVGFVRTDIIDPYYTIPKKNSWAGSEFYPPDFTDWSEEFYNFGQHIRASEIIEYYEKEIFAKNNN